MTVLSSPRIPIDPIGAADLYDELEFVLPDYALEYLEPTFFQNDPDKAAALVCAAPNEWRGIIALCAYKMGVPNPAYRAIIESVWNHDHLHLLRAAQGKRKVRRMIRAADFPIPFKGQVTVFRGTAKADIEKAAKGLSWTVSHEVACWFAVRSKEERPLVIKATVDSSEIIYYGNERNEQEVILRKPPVAQMDEHSARWEDIANTFIT